ncbi:MAG TPA: response regulator [Gaiellaceae bacterium]|nr:response regulator [Gaiellaceae bacterium]
MPELPTGTVTFVFTDVEGSTRLVRELGDSYVDMIAAHRRLVREALEEHSGFEVDSRGDEFLLAFRRPTEAVAAARAIQERHDSYPWPGEQLVRVRIGIHTGEPAIEDGDYVGLDVHLVARLCAAGHGGQILISQASVEALDDVEVEDLGEHELRGLDGREHIFQLVGPNGSTSFPPLRFGLSVDARAEPVGGSVRKDESCVRVALAEDGVLLREGMVRLLTEAGFEVVGQSGTADDLLLKVRSYSPDVAVVDIRMPPTQTDEGLRAAQEIRAKHPGVGVLVLSQHVEPMYAMELLAESAEGVGYLLKDRVADVEEFVAAVRRVAKGGSALDPSLVSELVGRQPERDPLEGLTRREREVLELMAEGRSNQAIGEALFITSRAVEKHVTNIFAKLGLPPAPEDHRRVLAVLAFLRP